MCSTQGSHLTHLSLSVDFLRLMLYRLVLGRQGMGEVRSADLPTRVIPIPCKVWHMNRSGRISALIVAVLGLIGSFENQADAFWFSGWCRAGWFGRPIAHPLPPAPIIDPFLAPTHHVSAVSSPFFAPPLSPFDCGPGALIVEHPVASWSGFGSGWSGSGFAGNPWTAAFPPTTGAVSSGFSVAAGFMPTGCGDVSGYAGSAPSGLRHECCQPSAALPPSSPSPLNPNCVLKFQFHRSTIWLLPAFQYKYGYLMVLDPTGEYIVRGAFLQQVQRIDQSGKYTWYRERPWNDGALVRAYPRPRVNPANLPSLNAMLLWAVARRADAAGRYPIYTYSSAHRAPDLYGMGRKNCFCVPRPAAPSDTPTELEPLPEGDPDRTPEERGRRPTQGNANVDPLPNDDFDRRIEGETGPDNMPPKQDRSLSDPDMSRTVTPLQQLVLKPSAAWIATPAKLTIAFRRANLSGRYFAPEFAQTARPARVLAASKAVGGSGSWILPLASVARPDEPASRSHTTVADHEASAAPTVCQRTAECAWEFR
jgi:hypothetical protein